MDATTGAGQECQNAGDRFDYVSLVNDPMIIVNTKGIIEKTND